MSERYNGWTNYETWRINLEMFDGFDAADYLDRFDFDRTSCTATEYMSNVLEDIAMELIREEVPSESGFAYNLAVSFLSKVDFEEIADHMVTDYLAENLQEFKA